MRKGFLIYEEMRKFFPIYEEAFWHTVYMNLHPIPIPCIWGNFIFFFISVAWQDGTSNKVLPACQAGNRFLGSLKGSQIQAQSLGSPGIDSKKSIPPAYEYVMAGQYDNPILLGS